MQELLSTINMDVTNSILAGVFGYVALNGALKFVIGDGLSTVHALIWVFSVVIAAFAIGGLC